MSLTEIGSMEKRTKLKGSVYEFISGHTGIWGLERSKAEMFSESESHGVVRLFAVSEARILEWVAFPFSRGSSNPGIEPRCPSLQVDSLPAESQ